MESKPLYIVVAKNKFFSSDNLNWRPLSELELHALSCIEVSRHYLGLINEDPYFVIEVSVPASDLGSEWFGLRAFLGNIDDSVFQLLGRALQLVTWHNDHRYCGRCGSETQDHDKDRAKECRKCDLQFYPRLSPCVIAVITRGKECLLGRSVKFPEGYYSALAGFIEPGETVESALSREIEEEVGVAIKNPSYFSSQPWPFPGQLMLGFHAEYAGGEICVDNDEIEDAQWFRYDSLPLVPPASTISGQLIEHFVAAQLNNIKAGNNGQGRK